MPIFEYTCEKCDHRFEYITFSSSDPAASCPKCKSKKLKKLMSAGSVRPNGIPTGYGGFDSLSCKPSGG